jgi:hypothetical protein
LTILVQARNDGNKLNCDKLIWRVVGAATTDSSGNFSMPYPFGIYTEAEAMTSLTPNHPVCIPITEVRDGNQTISDDFLFLLVQDVDCPHIENGEDCDCHAPKKASRLPGYADLIESDEYTQDIGGACVNLSTPNRTLSEFNYQAIVRTSDPDVANYTLKKNELDTATASIASTALTALTASNANSNAASTALNDVMTSLGNHFNILKQPTFIVVAATVANSDSLYVNASVVLKQLNDSLTALNAALIPLNTASLFALNAALIPLKVALSASENVRKILGQALGLSGNAHYYLASIVQYNPDASFPGLLLHFLSQLKLTLDAALIASNSALDVALKASKAVGAVKVETPYELNGGAEKIERRPIDLKNPVAWQDAPEDEKSLSIYQAVTVATGHILHYKSLFKADGYSLGDLIYSLPLAPGQKKQIVTFDGDYS